MKVSPNIMIIVLSLGLLWVLIRFMKNKSFTNLDLCILIFSTLALFYIGSKNKKLVEYGLFTSELAECGNNLSFLRKREGNVQIVDLSPGSSVEESGENLLNYLKENKDKKPEKYEHEYINMKYEAVKWSTIGVVGAFGAITRSPILTVVEKLPITQKVTIGAVTGIASYAYSDAAANELDQLREQAHEMVREKYGKKNI